jgi:hypothetical protein
MYYTLLLENHLFWERLWNHFRYFLFLEELVVEKDFDSFIFVEIGKHLYSTSK